jgi:prepilin-type N-terminal cleavage/methylation domain-containing protein
VKTNIKKKGFDLKKGFGLKKDFGLKKGFTLIEVLIAFAIFGAVGTFLFTSIFTFFRQMKAAQVLTQNSYDSLKKLELAAEEVERFFNDPAYNLGDLHTFTDADFENPDVVGEVAIAIEAYNPPFASQGNYFNAADTYLYKISTGLRSAPDESGNTTITKRYTYSMHIPDSAQRFPIAKMRPPNVVMENWTRPYAHDGLALKSAETLDACVVENPTQFSGQAAIDWYPAYGYNIPSDNKVMWDDATKESAFPIFSSSYASLNVEMTKDRLQSSYTFTSSPASQNLAGAHIVMVITAINLNGKLSSPVYTQPMFTNGLNLRQGITAHYDASWIMSTFPGVSHSSGAGPVTTSILNELTQGGVSLSSSPLNATGPSESLFAGRVGGSYSQYVKFAGSGFNANTPAPAAVFVVAKTPNANAPLIKIGSAFTLRGDGVTSGGANASVSAGDPALDGEWHVYAASISGGSVNFSIDKTKATAAAGGAGAPSGTLTIGGTNVEIAEVILYGPSAPATYFNDVAEYLTKKYKLN